METEASFVLKVLKNLPYRVQEETTITITLFPLATF